MSAQKGTEHFDIQRFQSVTFDSVVIFGYPGQTTVEVTDVNGGAPLWVGTISSKEQTMHIPISAKPRRITLSGSFYDWDQHVQRPYVQAGVRLTPKSDGYDWACDDLFHGLPPRWENFKMSIRVESVPWPPTTELSLAEREDMLVAKLVPTTALLVLTFQNTVQVEVSSDHTWSCPGDPHKVLTDRSGRWELAETSGTNLIGSNGELQVQIVDWELYSTFKGEQGGAHLFPATEDAFGGFEVTTVA